MNYYLEERILDTRQNELWILKNFKLNNLVVGNYLVEKNMKSGQVWNQYVRALYTIPIWLDNLVHIFNNFCCIYIFVYRLFSDLSVEVNKAFIF